jgi:hypothetical protein
MGTRGRLLKRWLRGAFPGRAGTEAAGPARTAPAVGATHRHPGRGGIRLRVPPR